MEGIRKVTAHRFENTYVGEIVELNGKIGKVVEVNHDVCARLRPLNFFERLLTKVKNLLNS